MDIFESSIIAALAAARAAAGQQKPTDRRPVAGGAAQAAAATARLMLLVFEDAYLSWAVPLDAAPVTVGRDPACKLRLGDQEVSREHCRIALVEGRVLLIDLGSTNGTFCNGQRVARAELREGDVVAVGKALIKLVVEGSAEWRIHRSLFQQIYSDELTGLLNRRGFRIRSLAWTARARPGTGFGLLMLGIDGFEQINQRRGHTAGDAVVVHVARTVGNSLPQNAFAARMGEETFAVLILETGRAQVTAIAEALRTAVCAQPAAGQDGPVECTVSVGCAFTAWREDALRPLFSAADAALRRAIAQGQNRSLMALPGAGEGPAGGR